MRYRRAPLTVPGFPNDLLYVLAAGTRHRWPLVLAEIARMLPDDLGFAGREHQGPGDAVNAALNYGYGVTRLRLDFGSGRAVRKIRHKGAT